MVKDDATPSTRCTSSSLRSLKSPRRWIDRTFHCCGIASRLMAMVMAAFFAAGTDKAARRCLFVLVLISLTFLFMFVKGWLQKRQTSEPIFKG